MEEGIVILSDVRSVHNVGSVFRTADGAGIKKIFLCGITPTPRDKWGRVRKDFQKVSLGAENHVSWEARESASDLISGLKKEGYLILALEQGPGSLPHDSEIRKGKKWALVVGSETEGIPQEILKKSDIQVEIPMRGSKESLNVSVAFGIAVYELTRN